MRVADFDTLGDLVRHAATQYGATPAFVSAREPDRRTDYRRLAELTRRGAAGLQSRGLVEGDRVLLPLETRPEWAASLFAIVEAGLVAVPIPAETAPETARAIADHAKAKAAVVSPRTKAITIALDRTRSIDIDELFSGTGEPRDVRHETAVIAFTSGSTSAPRGVELTHANLLANLDSLLQVRRATPGDSFLSILPPAHLFEMMGGLLAPVACGARVVCAGPMLPNRIIEALGEHRISHALAVPALIDCLFAEVQSELVDSGVIDPHRIRQSPDEALQRIESEIDDAEMQRLRDAVSARIGPAFRTLVVGGAACTPVVTKVIGAFGIDVEVGYGLTEASPIVSVGFAADCPEGSVGRPLPGVDVRIGERGEVLVRGASVMRGYLDDEAGTANALRDGWLRTGDRGHLDESGFLYITGRLKEVMVTASGETIYPDEVEPHYAHAAFAEHCVIGLSGPSGNDRPTLFVRAAAPSSASDDLEQLFRTLRADAPARLRVDGIVCVDRPLPRTASGKIRRRLVAQQYEEPR